MQYKIMLIEHNRLLLEQLSKVIENAPDMDLEARFQNSNDALGQGRVFNPNIILLDAELGNVTELLQDLLGVFPNASIICTGESGKRKVPAISFKQVPAAILSSHLLMLV